MTRLAWFASLTLASCTLSSFSAADERRAPPPEFSSDQLRGVFFDDLRDAIRGERPSLASMRQSAVPAAKSAAGPRASQVAGGGEADRWSPLISPASIEDEIKRVRLHYDSVISTPGAFNSGGFREARLDLTVLAVLFAVIHEHGGDVRWKDQAPAARDLLARTAFNCKAGSTQVYNEAKLRKADLQDLVSGTGLSNRAAEPENDWPAIADRSPLMEYAESLIERLEGHGRDETSARENADAIKRNAELLSALGEVLVREGMEEADDDDYVKLSRDMIGESKQVIAAIDRSDFGSIGAGISAIRQRCDICHEQYR